MKREQRILLGPIAAALLGCGIVLLACKVPGYSSVRQTVSEIGEMGSPARVPFAVLLCVVCACLLVFATAIRERCIVEGCSPWAAYLIACMAISAAGVGIFAFPHPLHNVFGLSELLGYQAPLAFALTWPRKRDAQRLVTFSWFMSILVWVTIAVNLSSIFPHGALWQLLKPVYGLVQRSLFAAWFGWCAVIGAWLWRWHPKLQSEAEPGASGTLPHGGQYRD